MESDDLWKRIRDSNAAATKGMGPSATAGREPKKRGPEQKGPSLKKLLSKYINLDEFDPTKPPDVEGMVEGMLELTGKSRDDDGFYREKAEKAVKAWKVGQGAGSRQGLGSSSHHVVAGRRGDTEGGLARAAD